jgi:hypothetical protein
VVSGKSIILRTTYKKCVMTRGERDVTYVASIVERPPAGGEV